MEIRYNLSREISTRITNTFLSSADEARLQDHNIPKISNARDGESLGVAQMSYL